MKKIKICDKEYEIDCNAYTYIQFKKVFGRGIFKDIQVMKDFFAERFGSAVELKVEENSDGKETELSEEYNTKLNKDILVNIDDYIEALTRITYILIYTANNENYMSYENFLKEIPRLSIDDDWILEVTEFTVEKFC